MVAIAAIARRPTAVDTRRLRGITVPTEARTEAMATRRRRHVVTVEEGSPRTAVLVITAQVEARVRTVDTSVGKLHSHHDTPPALQAAFFFVITSHNPLREYRRIGMTVYTASLDLWRFD